MTDAYEHDVHWLMQRIEQMKRENHSKGLPAKDLKPINFDSNLKTKLSFKQWSLDMYAWARKVDSAYGKLLNIATELKEWDAEAYKAKVYTDTKVDEYNFEDHDGELMDMLRHVTEGDSRDMVDAATCAGEA